MLSRDDVGTLLERPLAKTYDNQLSFRKALTSTYE